MTNRFFINRNFNLLWSANFISQTGDAFYAIALAWMVLERTRSPATMGLFLVASYLPGFLISPWVGAIIDRSARRRILVLADFTRGAVVGLASILVRLGHLQLWQILGVAVLLSIASAFFNPTARVVIPRIVPDDQLLPANSSMQFISGATSVAGPLLGAVLLASIGYFGAFLFNAVSFFLSGSLILLVRGPLDPGRSGPARSGEGGIRSGFRFIAGNPRLLVILAIIFGVHLFFGSLGVVLPFLANGLAGKGILNLGTLEAALGAGLVAGSVALNLRNREPRASALFKVIALLGIGILTIGAYQVFGIATPRAYAGSFVAIGVCVSMASVHWTTLMQRAVPDRIAGTVFAVASALGNIALPLAYGSFGLVLSAVSLGPVLIACGSTILAIGLVAGTVYAACPWKAIEPAPPLMPPDAGLPPVE
jgi:MFS family permease